MKINYPTPQQIFGDLFIALHMNEVLKDGKAISDAIPKRAPKEILADYAQQKEAVDFDIHAFFKENFTVTSAKTTGFKSDLSRPIQQHIEILWDVLKREADEPIEGSSRIPIRHPYIVPGGRFNEIYYWDSYFTMLGLQVSGRTDIIQGMVDNFSWMIDNLGFIPNGNRTYFLGRSQPPFYSLMVNLLLKQGNKITKDYTPYLEKEYAFWMDGKSEVNAENPTIQHVVYLKENTILNRYFDRYPLPRSEMYATDVQDFAKTNRDAEEFYGDIRAACESGWDFSVRWFEDGKNLSTIRTSKILPVDLNCLLYHLEKTISHAYFSKNSKARQNHYYQLAKQRKKQILTYFWNEKTGYFHDYDFEKKQLTNTPSLAGIYPLFFKIATKEQAHQCADFIRQHFLKPGGVVSTTIHSGQQWDAPNGWAPLQWMTIKGLRNYKHFDLANEIKNNWINLNKKVYLETGKMMEKYNVEDINLLSGGGEYDLQDGFGWTNGVLLKLMETKRVSNIP